MSNIGDQFSDHAGAALRRAEHTAMRLHHKTIGVEHILVGLTIGIFQTAGVANEVLQGLGLNGDIVTAWFKNDYIESPSDPTAPMSLATSSKWLLESSVLEARKYGHIKIGTGHLLLAAIRQRSQIIEKMLAHLEIDASHFSWLVFNIMLVNDDPKDRPMPRGDAPPKQTTLGFSWVDRLLGFVRALSKFQLPSKYNTDQSRITGRSASKNGIEVISALLKEQKNNPYLYIYRGWLNLCQKNFAAAEQDYTAAIHKKTDFALAYARRGFVRLYGIKDYAGAITDYSESIQRGNPYNYAYRGIAYFITGDESKASADFEEAIRRYPNDLVGRIGRSGIFLGNREFERCIAECDEVLRRDSHNTSALHGRGVAYAYLQDYMKAEANFEEMLRIKPDHAGAHGNQGWLALLRQDYDKAIEFCDKALRLDPELGAAYYTRGKARIAKGDRAGALSDYRLSLQHWQFLNTKLCQPYAVEMREYIEQAGG